MPNQEYILKSELRKMIEKENIYPRIAKKKLLSELENLSGVSGWIPEIGKNYFVGDGETKGKLLGFRFEFESGTIETIQHSHFRLPPNP